MMDLFAIELHVAWIAFSAGMLCGGALVVIYQGRTERRRRRAIEADIRRARQQRYPWS